MQNNTQLETFKVQLSNKTDNDIEIDLFYYDRVLNKIERYDVLDYKITGTTSTLSANYFSQKYITDVNEINLIEIPVNATFNGITGILKLTTSIKTVNYNITVTGGFIFIDNIEVEAGRNKVVRIELFMNSNIQVGFRNLLETRYIEFIDGTGSYNDRVLAMKIQGKTSIVDDEQAYRQFITEKTSRRDIVYKTKIIAYSEIQIAEPIIFSIEKPHGERLYKHFTTLNELFKTSHLNIIEFDTTYILDYKTFLKYKILKHQTVNLVLNYDR